MSTLEEGLNFVATNMSAPSSNRRFTYKEGTRVLYMRENKKKGTNKITFKLLPAFDPGNPDPSTSWSPSITPDGKISAFAGIMYSAKFAGRGDFTQRRELVSRMTEDLHAKCPLCILLQFISQNKEDWGYLTTDTGKYGTADFVRAALPPIAPAMLANVIDMYDQSRGVCVGEFSKSALNSLVNKSTGLMFQRNDNIPPELLQKNYMYQYAKGDLTDPNNGLVLVCQRGTDRKGFSGYELTVAEDPQGNPWRAQLTRDQMAQRYDMRNVSSFVNVPTEQELVDELVDMLQKRSPKGYHEWALLKMAFNDHGWNVPDPPSAPAATSNISLASTPAVPTTYPVQQAPKVAETNAYTPGPFMPGAAVASSSLESEANPQPVAQNTAPASIPTFVQSVAPATQNVQSAFPPSPAVHGIQGIPGETKTLTREEIMARLRK